ncbi:hypothetical protein [Marinoscillum sp.]|uniref:hypothetical protein n=1 Tax=Marinoscillum sp. TaxID=2024838 RepID=UPI003BAA1E33
MGSKRTLTALLFALAICSSGLLINCASYSSFQTARTLPQGKVSGTAGLGYNYLGEESFVDLALRVGLKDSVDIGLKANFTNWGSSLIMGDLKKQLATSSPNFSSALGLGFSAVTADDEGMALHVPAFFSFHSTNQKLALYLNPRVFYFFDLRNSEDRSHNNSGPGVGNSVGLKLGNRFAIMPEYSFFVGQYNDELKVNTLFSVGLGFRVP